MEQPRLLNMYGITETTVHTTFHQLTPEDMRPGAGNPVGHPLADLTVHLLDASGHPVPVGVPGEIHVGGPGVARGYLNRPALTAERFVPDPAGGRMYRSGDLASRRPDGSLDFLGRMDDQVKIRGFRIELGEIASALVDLPGVLDGVVVVREDAPGDKRLVGYVVADELDRAALREALARRLPEYMVPSAFVQVPRIPLNNNGKLDRRALPAPDRDALPAGHAYVAPRTPTEELVAGVWRDVLGVERVGVHDNFFDLGGHSIRAVALVGALRKNGIEVNARDVFEHGTVARLSERLTGQDRKAVEVPTVEPFGLISGDDRRRLPEGAVDAYPLAQAQLGILLEMLTRESLYLNVTSFRVRDERPFDLAAFREAARLVTARHEVLRTSFDLEGYSAPLQIVHVAAELPVDVRDLRELTGEAAAERVRAHNEAEQRTPFALDAAPQVRATVHLERDAWWLSVSENHAILDGWSHYSMLMELLDHYRTLRDGGEPDPVPLPDLRYADFVAAELRSLDSHDDRAFWRGVVEDHPRLALPDAWADRGPGEPYELTISVADLDGGLRRLARAAGTSLKSVMMAAHLKVMSQLTDQESFHSGLVLQARPEVDGVDRVYGLYLNTLPFPYVRGARTWTDLVGEVFRTETGVWQHRRFPMPAIQREYGDGGRLIETIFTYLDFEQVDTELVEVGGAMAGGGTEFPLAVGVIAGNLGITANTAVISRANAGRLAAMYRAVLEAMAADPAGDAQATYLPPGDREQDGTRRAGPYPTVHRAFEERARACPDAVAVVCGDGHLTYRQLDTEANHLAHHLRGLDAGPLVGVCLERGPELAPTLLGVLKSGAGYVPLDPSVPAERLRHMLSDSGVSVVVTTAALAPVIRGVFAGRVVLIDEQRAEIATCPGTPPGEGTPDDLMYVIYTSGSTGRPKGVCVTHAQAMWLLDETRAYLEIGDTDVLTLFASFANDVAVGEMFGALLNGGRLIVVPQDVTRSPEDHLDLLVRHHVTIIDQTPSSFAGLVRLARDGDPRMDGLALRAVLLGGEKLELADLAPWVDRFGLDRPALVNVYGNTEATSNSTFHRVTADDLGRGGSPIGEPMPGVRLRLLDRRGHLVPAGVPGEIHIGGAGVSRGYLGRPGLTAGRYVPDPYGPPGSRWYRTGDVGLRRPGGGLEFLGRADDQVKIRGHRVEPGEITALLQEQPGVRQAVVVVREDTPGDKRLVGYVVGDEVDPARLRAALARSLPDYMVPSAYVRVAGIPLNHNGKLDHRALPAPDRGALATGGAYAAPGTPTERALAEIWARALGVGEVGVYDTFFELGGHSILMIEVIRACKQAGLPVSLVMMYQHETIAGLAAALDAGARGAADAEQGPVTGELALTPIQRWFLAEEGRDESFAQWALLTVAPAADPGLVERALRELTRHHDVLRLRLDGDRAHLADEAALDPPRIVAALGEVPDLAADLAADLIGARAALVRVAGDLAAGHDLAAGKVIGAALSPSGDRLLLSVHHLAVDIVSWQILVDDLNAAYARLEAGEPVTLPAKTTSVRQWADRLAEHAESTELAAQAHHWLRRAPIPDLPVDRPGANLTADARTLTVTLPESLTSALLHRSGETAEETLLAALGLALTGWTGGDGFLVELEGHGRQEELFDDVDLSRTVGWFTTVYPFASWLPPGRKPQAVLRSVRDQLRSVPDRGIGHGLSRWLSPDEDLRAALAAQQRPEVLFNYTGQCSAGGHGRARFTLRPEHLGSTEGPRRPRSHLLEINAGVHEDRLHVHWTYSGRIHDEATVRRVAEDHLARLATLLEPARPAALPSPLAAMRRHGVPGVAVAVIRGAQVDVHTYGVLAAGGIREVTPDTLFQVGSIGKHLTAVGALRLVEAGLLDLDADVGDYLTSWRLPRTLPGAVTARHLLSHQAGLTRTDEDDFRRGEPMPGLLDLLPAVEMELPPGEHFRKSNGHYWVLEQLMSDITGKPYQELMRELVFEPLGMTATSYDLAFPETSGLPVAHGHDEEGRPVDGGWLVRPALAAGSLWSTAPDLAKVAIAVRRAHLGLPGPLSRGLAAELLTVAHRDALYGLGTSIDDTAGDIEFGHVGESAGYRSMMLSRIHRGTGFVVLTNSETGKEIHKHVAIAIGEQEGRRYGQGQGRTEAGYR
ncbi:amino acid adenylation domain-containing protein [Nonomuraea angiospora]|uniref:amino acid adenylation domain-containing protein n=1 Tax=Nonomuraea angiospora TaxID=46172 RepID=UPI00343A70FC